MVSRTMKRFDLHSKYPTACLHAVGPDASSTGALLLSLSTIAGTKISNPPWVNFQSAGWVSFQSAPTATRATNARRHIRLSRPSLRHAQTSKATPSNAAEIGENTAKHTITVMTVPDRS